MHAILYSFRRCPYAMRARLAIHSAGVPVELREVVLKNKPAQMLSASPKGTVPVLVIHSEKTAEPPVSVIDESLDIMHWAFEQHDPDRMSQLPTEIAVQSHNLIDYNDNVFKSWLDRYKYFERFPEHSQEIYRTHCTEFMLKLEHQLEKHPFLLGENPTIADLAIFPFIRQCAHVDFDWFATTPYHNLQNWLQTWINSPLFLAIMQKYKPWEPETQGIDFGTPAQTGY